MFIIHNQQQSRKIQKETVKAFLNCHRAEVTTASRTKGNFLAVSERKLRNAIVAFAERHSVCYYPGVNGKVQVDYYIMGREEVLRS